MAVVIYRMCDGLCVLADGRSVVRYCCRDQSPEQGVLWFADVVVTGRMSSWFVFRTGIA